MWVTTAFEVADRKCLAAPCHYTYVFDDGTEVECSDSPIDRYGGRIKMKTQ